MGVNTLSIEQSYQMINDLHEQATGQTGIAPTSLADFISMAQSTLRAGYDKVMNAISVVLGDTIVAVREYEAGELSGLEIDATRWGGIKRKINFIETAAEPSRRWNLIDGQSVDQYEIKKPKVLETHFYGFDVYSDWRSITESQLEIAFSSPEELGAFMVGLATHFNNMYMQWKEDQRRAIICNLIGACSTIGGDKVVHLLTEYNTATGQSLTKQTVLLPANYAAFIRWTAARLETLADFMAKRSEKFQLRVTNKPIERHTAPQFLKAYMLSDLKNKIDAIVRSDTFDNSYMRMIESQSVAFWQSIEDPDKVQVTPAYVDPNLEITTASPVALTDVVGVFMDRDAAGYTVRHERVEATPKNVAGDYYNIWLKADIQLMNDLTEKSVVLMLD